jgi:plastocyanin
MNNKNIAIILVVLVLVIGGVLYFMKSNDSGTIVMPTESDSTTGGATTKNSGQPSTTAVTTTTTTVTTPPAPAPTPVPVVRNINITGFKYDPASLTVKKGDTVVWTNLDSIEHTVTGTNGGPDSNTISFNQKYSYVFDKVGTFPYTCKIHPNMKGTITVTN